MILIIKNYYDNYIFIKQLLLARNNSTKKKMHFFSSKLKKFEWLKLCCTILSYYTSWQCLKKLWLLWNCHSIGHKICCCKLAQKKEKEFFVAVTTTAEMLVKTTNFVSPNSHSCFRKLEIFLSTTPQRQLRLINLSCWSLIRCTRGKINQEKWLKQYQMLFLSIITIYRSLIQ